MPDRKPQGMDLAFFVTTLALVCFGVVMVYSASMQKANTLFNVDNGYEAYFFLRQLLWAGLGLIALLVASKVPYTIYKKLSLPFLVLCLVLNILVPFIGVERNGAVRWLGFGPFTIQPSELAKVALVFYLSLIMSSSPGKIRDFFKGLVPMMAITGLFGGIILLQDDLGTAISLCGTAFILFFAGGANMAHLIGLGAAGIGAVVAAIIFEPYRMRRITAFFDPWSDPLGKGYQIIQSLYAIGPGGLLGVGFTQSRQKHFYLPEPHTDFIFAIIAEELGFIGCTFLIFLFLLFIWRGYRIAIQCKDPFGSLLAAGLTTMIALQAAINLAVVTGSIPTTGIPLPFISYGGSSLLFTLTSVGVILNISRYAVSEKR